MMMIKKIVFSLFLSTGLICASVNDFRIEEGVYPCRSLIQNQQERLQRADGLLSRAWSTTCYSSRVCAHYVLHGLAGLGLGYLGFKWIQTGSDQFLQSTPEHVVLIAGTAAGVGVGVLRRDEINKKYELVNARSRNSLLEADCQQLQISNQQLENDLNNKNAELRIKEKTISDLGSAMAAQTQGFNELRAHNQRLVEGIKSMGNNIAGLGLFSIGAFRTLWESQAVQHGNWEHQGVRVSENSAQREKLELAVKQANELLTLAGDNRDVQLPQARDFFALLPSKDGFDVGGNDTK